MDNVKKKENDFVSISTASTITGLSFQTLRILADKEKIASYRTPSGQRRFNRKSLQEMCNPSLHDVQSQDKQRKTAKRDFIYARVSSRKQMDDLSRQVEFLKSRRNEYVAYNVVQDIGSGINFQRKGLQTILDACLQGTIGTVVVAHRDRLARFAFSLIEYLIVRAGGNLTVIDDVERDSCKTSEQELSEDLLSIIHVYSCKQMGRRKYRKHKRVLQEAENFSEQQSKKSP